MQNSKQTQGLLVSNSLRSLQTISTTARAIEHLLSNGKKINTTNISRLSGLSRSSLNGNPIAKSLINEYKKLNHLLD